MKSKHEQLYVAVQDLLIELGITPKKLRFIATQPSDYAASEIMPKTAQKLIDADLIVEEINWNLGGHIFGPRQEMENKIGINDSMSEHEIFLERAKSALLTFDKIKADLPPGILWSYLRENHPDFLYEQIKDYLFPGC